MHVFVNAVYLEIVVVVVEQAIGEHVASGVAGAYVILGRNTEHFRGASPVAVGDGYVRVRPRQVRHRVSQKRELPHALKGRVQRPEQRPERGARLVHAVGARKRVRARQTNRVKVVAVSFHRICSLPMAHALDGIMMVLTTVDLRRNLNFRLFGFLIKSTNRSTTFASNYLLTKVERHPLTFNFMMFLTNRQRFGKDVTRTSTPSVVEIYYVSTNHSGFASAVELKDSEAPRCSGTISSIKRGKWMPKLYCPLQTT